jgi:murein tripeptide amidase MpaA
MSKMLSRFCATLGLSEFPISEQSINEIDEALGHASRARNLPHYTTRQRAIVDEFIDDLLEIRWELTKC